MQSQQRIRMKPTCPVRRLHVSSSRGRHELSVAGTMASTLPMAAVCAGPRDYCCVAQLIWYPRSSPGTSRQFLNAFYVALCTDPGCPAQDDWLVGLVTAVLRSPTDPVRVAVVFAIQAWLAETPEQKRTSTTPAYFQVGMSSKFPPISIVAMLLINHSF